MEIPIKKQASNGVQIVIETNASCKWKCHLQSATQWYAQISPCPHSHSFCWSL